MTSSAAHSVVELDSPKPVELVTVPPPPEDQRARRGAAFAAPGQRRTRYSLPSSLESPSPVGYRTRVPLSREEAQAALSLLSLSPPTGFAPAQEVREGELFEEVSLGVLSSRQSTNFRGHREVVLGPELSSRVADLLRRAKGRLGPALEGASYTHVVFSRPYRTPFTMLLTLVGHRALTSPFGVAGRLWKKKIRHGDDIPTIGYLQHLHLGILADAMERATLIASSGRRRAMVHLAPFTGHGREENAALINEFSDLCGLTLADRLSGWRVALVAQVGEALDSERVELPPETWEKIGANLMALRSERIQPGVNQEQSAPEAYQQRQDMDIPEALTVQAGRAGYNAFARWTGCDRERAKELLLVDRIDVLTPNGKQRLRAIREHLGEVTDRVVRSMPAWADLPTGKAFSRNAERGRKAFALAGQRIYIGGLSRREVENEGLDWEVAVQAMGAAASRAGLVAELSGLAEMPSDVDLLTGVCLMAGPVNQNDIGKAFFGARDLLDPSYGDRDPTSLLVWTLKAKTVADPIGNEEQLLNPARKGALVDLRAGPHEVVRVQQRGELVPMRQAEGRVNSERAFGRAENFVTDAFGRGIPGNRGAEWPGRDEIVWKASRS